MITHDIKISVGNPISVGLSVDSAEDFSVDVNGEKGTYDTTISIDPPT